MKVKDQIAIRMEQLDMDVGELARRVKVSNQSVRHWLSGRSFPGKRHAVEVEAALSFKIDFTEGASAKNSTVEAMLQIADGDLYREISKLPPNVKALFKKMAQAYSANQEHC